MSIMDFFRGAQPTSSAATQQTQQVQQTAAGPTTIPTSANPNAAAPTTTPGQQPGQMPGSSGEPTDPMAEYAKLFAKADPKTEQENSAPSFVLPADKLAEHASKQNFLSGADQELVQKATNGDVTALMALMNTAAQRAYQASLAHQSQLTDAYVKSHSQHTLGTAVNDVVTSTLTQQAFSKLPNYKSPVIREQLNETAARIRKANPDASPDQIAQAAIDYLNKLHAALNPDADPQSKDGQQGKDEFDWDKYLGS